MHLYFSRLTLVFICLHLIQGIATFILNHQQFQLKTARHQFLKLWLTKLSMNSLQQVLKIFTLDRHSKSEKILHSNSSHLSSIWWKLIHSGERHMKMLVLIFRITWRLVVQLSSRTLIKISYSYVFFHSLFWEKRSSGSLQTEITLKHGRSAPMPS